MQRFPKLAAIVASLVMVVASSTSKSFGKDIVDTAVEAGSFQTLAAALEAADLIAALKGTGPFTVLAPTDKAFAKLPQGTVETLLRPENKQTLADILTFHVIRGRVGAAKVVQLSGAKSLNGQRINIQVANGKLSVNQAKVVQADIVCDNGIIHVIDQVILPASDDIAKTAVDAGNFTTLVAAAKAGGLVEALSGDGPLTVFAPTDDAFAKLPAGTVESLLKPENKTKLVSILKYHVVPGRVYFSDALAAGSAATLQGSKVSVTLSGVNDAKFVTADLDASNGVIHVIDSVLLPPEKTSSVHPRTMIKDAIAQGAPLYNGGHAGQCARIYMTTARDILAMENHGMSPSTVNALQTALTNSKHTHSVDTQAWIMRHALDLAYNDMSIR